MNSRRLLAHLAVLFAARSAHAAPPAALVVIDAAEWRSQLAADGLGVLFAERGFTVDVKTALPADLSPYCSAWDLRPATALSAADVGAWTDFLALGRGLTLIGEFESCCAARNLSLIDLVNGAPGGGPASVGSAVVNDFEEDAEPGLEATTRPYSIRRVRYSFGTSIADPGRGKMVTRDGSNSQILALWDRGDLGGAPDGRLAIALDIEWMAQFQLLPDNRRLIANLAELLCPATGHGVVVELSDPAPGMPLNVECGRDFEVSGFVIGNTRGGSCVGGPEPPPEEATSSLASPGTVPISAIEVSLDGGPFVAVASTTPALPALPPVEFTAAGLRFDPPLGPHPLVVRAVDELGNEGRITVVGDLQDNLAPVSPPGWCDTQWISLDAKCEAMLPVPPPAIDLCDPSPRTIIVPPHPLFFSAPGFASTFYGWTDASGHTRSCARTLVLVDDAPPSFDCARPLTLECEGPHGVARDSPPAQAWLATTTATDNCSRATLGHDAPALFPPGCEPGRATAVTWTASDEAGNVGTCRVSLSVIDTTPPALGALPFDGTCLWPPNHAFWCVADVTEGIAASDLCDPDAPEVRVLSCRSSEPQDSTGDGRFAPDCVIRDGGRGFCVRAERDGGEPGGRVYTIEIGAADRCGNVARREA